MKIQKNDRELLEQLCQKYNLSTEKVLRLLKVIKEYEYRDKRIGIYESLKEIINTNVPKTQ